MKLLFIGDSHVAALATAHGDLTARGQWPADLEVSFPWGGSGGEWRAPLVEMTGDGCKVINPGLKQLFGTDLITKAHVADVILCICATSHSLRVWRDQTWVRHAPLSLARTELPVSDGVLERIVLDDQDHALTLVAAFAKLGARMVAIEGPRPFAIHKAMTVRGIRRDIVLHIDRFYRRAAAAKLKALGIPLVAVPLECLDADGFMKPELKHMRVSDQHHGNAAFGAIMMKRVAEAVRAAFGAEA